MATPLLPIKQELQQQHEKLYEQLGKLNLCLSPDHLYEQFQLPLNGVIAMLRQQLSTHFQTEESLLKQLNLSHSEKHCLAHQTILNQLEETQTHLLREAMLKLNILRNSLEKHELHYDVDLFRLLEEQEKTRSP